VAAFCPRCEGGSECGGSELASEMEASEDWQGGGVLFIGRDGGEGRNPVGIESAMSGAPLNLWCTSFQEGEVMN
jgi:hypothetical protein